MVAKTVAPYGSWCSPITSDLIVSETVGLSQVMLDGDDAYWVELRPAEGGRCVVVQRAAAGEVRDVIASPYSARSRVHEYGGGAFAVADGTVWFSNFGDQRLYRQAPGGRPEVMTPTGAYRYADGIIDRQRGRLIGVCEDHSHTEGEAINTLVSIDFEREGEPRVLVSGSDFYASPCLSPDGSRLAWLSWNHPNMPWDGTELWVGALDAGGRVASKELVAGGVDEAIFQPAWSPDGELYFVSDRAGWWNICRWRSGQVEAVTDADAEFGLPHWVFGQSTYGFEAADRIICCYCRQGEWHLGDLDTNSLELEEIGIPYSEIRSVRAAPGKAVFVGASRLEFPSVIELDLTSHETTVLRSAGTADVDASYFSIPEPIAYRTEGGLTAHAFFYAPRNRHFEAAPEERPPLLVMSHGGPTAATTSGLQLPIQYWTSRGIGVLDVNYGGSTGYGRAYRQRLDGQWGIVDVNDCVNGARFLAARGDVDTDRLMIRGGSAGGFTTLCALIFGSAFKAGASRYGVSDLEALAKDTHKFESRYLDRLIGPYPKARELYLERSPIYAADRLSCPVIFFQGLEDEIVPPNQTEMMVDALRAKGIPVAYLAFEGEQHGFRRAENIKRALDAELYFYSRVFDFQLAEPVEPVRIDNL
jgi:dipeptidyl aminopeptidase/acylaminoacyl peptidase